MNRRVDAPAVLARWTRRALSTRWLVRAPIAVFRTHLGGALGSRFLLLEHRGRRSGRWRRVILEVVDRPGAGRYLVVSGLGPQSEWFRHVAADPVVRVQVGGGPPGLARAEVLGSREAAAALQRYRGRHPAGWQMLESSVAAGQPPRNADHGPDGTVAPDAIIAPVVELTVLGHGGAPGAVRPPPGIGRWWTRRG